nr:reverse transcriptase domain-containing protein [Tanacetum cinerariifolium]
MRTRSSSNLIVESFTIPKRRNRRRSKQIVELELRTIVETPVANMADTRTMSELLHKPTEGYKDVIVIPSILAENFELKVELLRLVTSSQFHGFERDDPHSHIRWFNKITSTLKYKNVPQDAIKLMLFSFSLEGTPGLGLKKNPLILSIHGKISFLKLVLMNKANQQAFVKAIKETCVTCGGLHPYYECLATGGNTFDACAAIQSRSFIQMQSPSGLRSLPSNTIANPRGDLKAISTQSGVAYDGPTIPPTPYPFSKVVEREIEATKDKVQATSLEIDYDVDPRVPLIIERLFLRTSQALIDVHDVSCEEYAQEVLGFLDSSTSGNPTPLDPIIASSSPMFTPFEGSNFILEEIETFLHTPDELSTLDDDFDPEGDIPLIEKLLNKDPSSNLPSMKNEDLKQADITMMQPSIKEPPELELKDLPSHLEYAFLEGTDKLSVIISKELKDEEKAALLKVLKSHKQAIAWKISDIKGIDPRFYTHKILMEDDFKLAIQHPRRVNLKIYEVIKKEIIKLLDAELIYPISDSPWVSLVHCVPKKGGMTVVENEDNELIPTRLVTGCRIRIEYRKLNDATRKDHFPLPLMDQMLERIARNKNYCFLDGFSGYFQILIDSQDQEKTTFT